jgi:hypothetical protein
VTILSRHVNQLPYVVQGIVKVDVSDVMLEINDNIFVSCLSLDYKYYCG